MKREGVIYHDGFYRLSRRLRILKYCLAVFLAILSLVLFLTFRRDMTLGHLRYLLRNFDFSPNASDTSGNTIYYDGDPDSLFGFVSGGFATVTDTRVFVTDRSSSTTFSLYHGYRDPRALFSSTYMLLYDREGSRVTVMNAFATVNSLSCEGTVQTAALSENGRYAVAYTPKRDFYTVVTVYDKDGRVLNRLSKYKYVNLLSFSADGKTLLVGSRYSDADGRAAYELLVLDVGNKEPRAIITSGETVFRAAFLESGEIAAITKDAIHFYSPEGKLLHSQSLPKTPELSFIGKNGVMTVSGGDDTRESVFSYTDRVGSRSYTLPCRVYSLAEDETTAYILGENGLWAFYKKTGELIFCSGVSYEDALMLVSDGENVYIATSGSAHRLSKDALISQTTAKDSDMT